jgi:hypothetical protein
MIEYDTLLLKRNDVSGIVPKLTSIDLGEPAVNTADGQIYLKKKNGTNEYIVTFFNNEQIPYLLNLNLSSINTQFGNNVVISEVAGVLGGQNNLVRHRNSFALGTNLSSHASNFLYVNNVSGVFWGDGSNIYNIYDGSDLKALSGYWQSAFNFVSANSAYLNSPPLSSTINFFTSNSAVLTSPSLTSTITFITSNSSRLLSPILSSSITSDINVGAISAGQLVLSGTTFQQFAEKLLNKIFYPTFINPSVSLTTNIPSNVESGTIGVSLTATFDRGSINGKNISNVWDPIAFQNYRSGSAHDYIIMGVNTGTVNYYTSAGAVINDGSNVLQASVGHFSGPQPYDNKGNNYDVEYPSNYMIKTTNIVGRRKCFYGVDSLGQNSAQVRSLTSTILNPTNGMVFDIPIPIGSTSVIFAYPSSLRDVTSVEEPVFKTEIKTAFTKTLVNVEGANSYPAIGYKVYVFTPVQPFTQSSIYTVII